MACHRRGFTLIECLAAVALVAAVLALTMQLVHASAVQRRAVQQRELAIQELANLMERLSILPWQDLSPEKARSMQLSEHARGALPGAELTIDVTASSEGPQAKRILISLRWEDESGRPATPLRLAAWRYRDAQPGNSK